MGRELTRIDRRAREERWITSKRETATETVIPTSTFHKSVKRNVSPIMARSAHAPNLDESVSPRPPQRAGRHSHPIEADIFWRFTNQCNDNEANARVFH